MSAHSFTMFLVQIPESPKGQGGRARPLALDERQAMIIDAVIPLLVIHGRDLTSKQIAEAAGIAEGTVFRAFGDKETLIEAAIEKILDPEPLRRGLRGIDASLPLEEKVATMVALMQTRFSDMFRIMAVIGQRPPKRPDRQVFAEIIADALEPELERLNWPPMRVAHIIRMLTFASAFPQLNDGLEFTPEELAGVLLYGIAGRPTDASPTTQESQD